MRDREEKERTSQNRELFSVGDHHRIKMSTGDNNNNNNNKKQSNNPWSVYNNLTIPRVILMTIAFVFGVAVSCLVFFNSGYPFMFQGTSSLSNMSGQASLENHDYELDNVLRKAAMKDKTVILTTSNQAWAKPQSIVDVFLESFEVGINTKKLLDHLVIVSVDQMAHNRCLVIHPHCYALKTEGLNLSSEASFMTPGYLELMWRRIDFLGSVLQLGYNFVFTDADIVWLRDPFPQFDPKADFQIACDRFKGSSYDKRNQPNGGFNYVKSNPKTIQFYKYWYTARTKHPGLHDQDVLNKIKFDAYISSIGLQMRFLDTAYFGGFCEPSKDFNLVCTMHANCCIGLKSKIEDLKLVVDDWRKFQALPSKLKALPSSSSWRAPQKCRNSFHPPNMKKSEANNTNKSPKL